MHRPLKLLMTTDTAGGVWHYALDLCRALARWRIEIVLAAMGPPAAAQEDRTLSDNVQFARRPGKLEWMQDCEADVTASGNWLLALAREHDVDAVHINGYAHAALPFGRPVVAVAHSDVVSWFHAVRHEPPPESWQDYKAIVKRGLSAAAIVVAPTDSVRRDVSRHFGLVSARCAVIANGIALEDCRPAPKEEIVLSAGRLWDEAKNVGMLDRIAPGLPWPIEIAGDPRHPDGGTVALRNLRMLGALSRRDMAARMASAAIYAAPARYEPFGLAILEAASGGCALVLSDIPSLRENWDGAAVFVPPADVDGWSRAIGRLIEMPHLRQEMSIRATARAARFDVRDMAGSYVDLYRHLVDQRPAAHG